MNVVHIKTDSIKIANATDADWEFIRGVGEQYGYEFEHEDTYSKFCLVDKAQYIAKKADGKWEAVGAQFQHPYVYKTLFSGETLDFKDYCEAKQVTKGAIYLDFNHDTPMVTAKEGLKFVGRTGLFTPVAEGQGGAVLYRIADDKHYKVTGTSGHLWMESDMAKANDARIDMSYFHKLRDNAIAALNTHGDAEAFCGD
jgi:hypothetical protein